jgi:hypothetical protein
VNWDATDFTVAGVMLAVTGLLVALVLRRSGGNRAYRSAAGLAILAAFLLVWINGAVGIIGDEGDPANLMFAGVLAVALAGSAASRFRAAGMARAMFATAGAQVLVAAIALAAGFGRSGPAWPTDVLVASAMFTALWLGSALLFRKAANS